MTRNPKHRQPSRAAVQKVRDAFDPDALKHLCVTWDLSPWAKRVDLAPSLDGRERFYWHRDNGSNILAVAHLDTVQDDRACQITNTAGGLLATSGALDDRLGAYVILDLLPRLGMTFDVLLTTDEEIGQSTADSFETDKQYDWLIQFDRGGTDVVMYDYETRELVELVEASGARVGNGSFSDICNLEHLGCAGMNWGVGYQDYHSARSHAWLEDTFRMVARFGKFYRANRERRFEHEPRPALWWKDDALSDECIVEADCGHDVDLANPDEYVDLPGNYLICAACNE